MNRVSKRLLNIIQTIVIIFMGFIFCIAFEKVVYADMVIIDGSDEYSYYQNGAGITITGYSGNETDLHIPDILNTYHVTAIGNDAFIFNGNLKSVTIPYLVTSIGKQAFRGCSSLERVTIEGNINTIGEYAFYGCSRLEYIGDSDGSAYIGPINFIWRYTFAGCSSLKKFFIPKETRYIAENAFWGTDSFEGFHYDLRNEYFYVDYAGVLYNHDQTKLIKYPAGSDVTNYKIPATVTQIGTDAFRNSDISNVELPDGLVSVGDRAFYGCKKLQQIILPNTVTTLGVSCFSQCSELKILQMSDSITEIGEYAFAECSGLEKLALPSSLKSIGENAFIDCRGLKTIALDEQNDDYKIIDGILYTKDGTHLVHCPARLDVICYSIPDTVIQVDNYAFQHTKSLEYISIPASVEKLGQGCFEDTGIHNLTVPDTISSVDSSIVRYCENLTAIAFPEGMSYFNWPLWGCENLEYIVLPSTIMYVLQPDDYDGMESPKFKDTLCLYVVQGTGAEKFAITSSITYCYYTPETICSNGIAESNLTTGHIIVTDPAVASNCAHSGRTEGSHCLVCGTVVREQEEIAPTGHAYELSEIKRPTYSEEGFRKYQCKHCGESFKETIPRLEKASVSYRTHVQTYGWQAWVKNGSLSGTSGKAKRLEAIQIRLTGEMAQQYDVYCRVHAQHFGWLDWASNGQSAGTAGYSYRLEAIEIKLVEKGKSAPGSTKNCYYAR